MSLVASLLKQYVRIVRKHMNDFTKEDELVHKLENLRQYLNGAHSVCDHDNSSATFHGAAHTVQEIILWIKVNE